MDRRIILLILHEVLSMMDKRSERFYRDFILVAKWVMWWDKFKYTLLTIAAMIVIYQVIYQFECVMCGEEDD